jgi:UPF0042 nucleotide-binding protein
VPTAVSLPERATAISPLLETNNRSYLTVAIGCTGGKHRSVYIAEQLADYFRSRGKNVQSRHRTLEKRKT